ncbi:MAG: SHOCT domain-containing protein [Nitrospira sp. CG24E]|nr:MAG: SHOCT domain-containing protein [Nitrospira sp. CG24E]
MRILVTRSEQTQITFSLAAIVMASLLSSCASSPTFPRTVYEDPTILVRLDSPLFQEEVSSSPAGHIPELTAADLAELLRSVRIQPESSFVSYWIMRNAPQPELAFPNDDAALLAPHLQRALAKARSNETVVFFLLKTRADGIPLVTTGGLLIHGDQLVVLLAHAGRPTTTQRKIETARGAPLHPLGELDFHFVPGPHQTTPAKKDLPKSITMTSAPALSVNYRAWLAGLLPPGRGTTPSQTEQEIPAAMIEEKLRRLKTLHEQGLITDDEYLQKRQDLLKHF